MRVKREKSEVRRADRQWQRSDQIKRVCRVGLLPRYWTKFLYDCLSVPYKELENNARYNVVVPKLYGAYDLPQGT